IPGRPTQSGEHPRVQELRELSKWSDGHIWISPEQHGNLTGIFKQQIDWIPLCSGSVRPTHGRTLAIAQVSEGSVFQRCRLASDTRMVDAHVCHSQPELGAKGIHAVHI
ncbi:uncharacterized protein BKA55DRAFT_720340, partial [Fusarium redolens]